MCSLLCLCWCPITGSFIFSLKMNGFALDFTVRFLIAARPAHLRTYLRSWRQINDQINKQIIVIITLNYPHVTFVELLYQKKSHCCAVILKISVRISYDRSTPSCVIFLQYSAEVIAD